MTTEPPLDCAEVVRSLWEYLDDRVEPASVTRIEDHLARCEGCRAYAEFERRLMGELVSLRRSHSDPARLRNDVLSVLRAAGMGNGADSEGDGR